MVIGELVIKSGKTVMMHGDALFGEILQAGIGGYTRGWRIRIPSLNFVGFEKSREVAENLLVSAYVSSKID